MAKIYQIDIVGHTNVGKTTLMNCLANDCIGIEDDKANTTLHSTYYFDKTNNILYVDNCGFQSASELNYIERHVCKYNDLTYNEIVSNMLLNEIRCIRSLTESNVVYYVVAPNSYIPESRNDEEINLIKNINTNIIGIVNIRTYKTDNHRVNLWETFFKNHKIEYILFDIKTDNNATKKLLFDKTNNMLLNINNYSNALNNIDTDYTEQKYQYNILKIKKGHIDDSISNYKELVFKGTQLYYDVFKYNLLMNKYYTLQKFDDVMNYYNACWIIDNFNFDFYIESQMVLAYDIYTNIII